VSANAVRSLWVIHELGPSKLHGHACPLRSESDHSVIITVSQSSTGTVRIRMHNKLAALVVLGKYLGLFDQRRTPPRAWDSGAD